MAQNPCEDIKLDNTTQVTGSTGVRSAGNTGDTPEEEVSEPEAQDPIFAGMFTDQSEQQSDQGHDRYASVYRASFATAVREMSTIPNSLFLTAQTDVNYMSDFLQIRNQNRGSINVFPLHGALWFRNNPAAMTTADLFRWSLYAIWNSNANSEYFVRKACGPHDNFFQPNDILNAAGHLYTDEKIAGFDQARILDIYRGSPHPNARSAIYDAP